MRFLVDHVNEKFYINYHTYLERERQHEGSLKVLDDVKYIHAHVPSENAWQHKMRQEWTGKYLVRSVKIPSINDKGRQNSPSDTQLCDFAAMHMHKLKTNAPKISRPPPLYATGKPTAPRVPVTSTLINTMAQMLLSDNKITERELEQARSEPGHLSKNSPTISPTAQGSSNNIAGTADGTTPPAILLKHPSQKLSTTINTIPHLISSSPESYARESSKKSYLRGNFRKQSKKEQLDQMNQLFRKQSGIPVDANLGIRRFGITLDEPVEFGQSKIKRLDEVFVNDWEKNNKPQVPQVQPQQPSPQTMDTKDDPHPWEKVERLVWGTQRPWSAHREDNIKQVLRSLPYAHEAPNSDLITSKRPRSRKGR